MKRFSTSLNKSIFRSIQLGPYELRNKIGMAAMTRCRSDPKTAIPNDLHVQYYSERAENAGFVLTECTGVSKGGNCFPGGCGIWNQEQIDGWKRVNEAVHKVNGRIYAQIFHGGRAARSVVVGEKPVSASAIPIRTPGKNGKVIQSEVPEALTEEGINKIVEQFRVAAENAMKAGFDGIEIHGANGYLIDSFLRDCTNQREDKFGGSFENRCRFPLMVMDALISVAGADKVGIKVSPTGRYQDMFDSNPLGLYTYLLQELSKRKVSFVEVMRGPDLLSPVNFYDVKEMDQLPNAFKSLKPAFNGVFIGNSDLKLEEANTLIENGEIDMATFGRPYIANPDLVHRFRNGWPLAQPDFKTIYNGGKDGYIYPKF